MESYMYYEMFLWTRILSNRSLKDGNVFTLTFSHLHYIRPTVDAHWQSKSSPFSKCHRNVPRTISNSRFRSQGLLIQKHIFCLNISFSSIQNDNRIRLGIRIFASNQIPSNDCSRKHQVIYVSSEAWNKHKLFNTHTVLKGHSYTQYVWNQAFFVCWTPQRVIAAFQWNYYWPIYTLL